MSVPVPTTSGYTVYTKSNCGWCRRVKNMLLNTTVYNCDDFLKKDRETFLKQMDDLTRKEFRTFPMVFFNGEFVGGYEDTKQHIDFNTSLDF